MTYVYLSVDHVLKIHRKQIDEIGGLHGIRDVNALESALARSRSGYYNSIIEEAAALLESIVINHPFNDGNKRAAHVATATFLELNGILLTCDPDSADHFIRSFIICKEDRFDRIVEWITSHTQHIQ